VGILEVIAFLAVSILPGAWITFGLPLANVSFSVRVFAAIALSPFVIFLQYCLASPLGLSFPAIVLLLLGVNALALWAVWRRIDSIVMADWRSMVFYGLVTLVPLACLAPQILDTQARIYSGHNWMHAAIISQFANGNVIPEEPSLAGIRLAYPWSGHVLQALQSYLLDSAPVSSYIWTNLLVLAAIFGLAVATVRELRPGTKSGILVILWLSFGVNWLGYLLLQSLPVDVLKNYPVWGDYRYTPWLMKFYFFEQMKLGLALVASLVFFISRGWGDAASSRDHHVMIAILLAGTGVIYPLLLPTAFAVAGSRLLLPGSMPWTSGRAWRERAGLLVALLLSAVVTYLYIRFVTQERVTGTGIGISTWWGFKKKAVESLIVLLPLLAGLAVAWLRSQEMQRLVAGRLAVGGLGICFLYAFFHIPNIDNEYKFMFAAALCLAPFPVIAMEPLFRTISLRNPGGAGILAAVLVAPFVHKLERDWPWPRVAAPHADAAHFELRLDDGSDLDSALDMIRRDTPANSILFVDQPDVYLPVVTGRSEYVPPDLSRVYPGISLSGKHILETVKGYDPEVIARRAETARVLYHSRDGDDLAGSLSTILRLGRPLAIVTNPGMHDALDKWLSRRADSVLAFSKDDIHVWIVTPPGPGSP